MASNPELQAESTLTPELGVLDRVRTRACKLLGRRTELWAQARHFGAWFETEAATMAEEASQTEVVVELDPEGRPHNLRIGPKRYEHDLERYQRLWTFLNSLGVARIQLDARLERNQIEDVVSLLYCRRRAIREGASSSNGIVNQLSSANGVHVACTQTAIVDRTLRIVYTYCTLRFSQAVHWFEERHRRFHDHRTLFYAAPRYGVLITAVACGPALIIAALHAEWLLFGILAVSALALFALTYALFMIIGSVEYDNEEKAYNLGKAYGQLRRYTEKIQADIERARTVQEKFVPATEQMPFHEHLTWAASFVPATEVGGDYFDVAPLDETRVAILFSDVSGHGMGAAFITAVMKTTFQGWLDGRGTLEELASQLNANLSRLVPLGSFAAAFVAVYDIAQHGLVYANCGHQPEPWHLPAKATDPIRALDDARNLVLGIREQTQVTPSCMLLHPGDSLLFVSDGITENPNAQGRLYGTDRFEAFLQSKRSFEPAMLVQAISNEAHDHSDGADQTDDQTILTFRVTA
jgi:sigma-B regulation protein RsbU (phosphoserine phosphatase)